jgi:putative ABC transport system permease protein
MLTTILKSLWSRKRRLLGTCIAVVLGVAFLAGTMILGDTTKSGFSSTFASANDGTDVVVRNATRIGSEEDRTRGLIDESMVADVASVSGVAAAVPEVRGVAQIIGADGKPVGGNGPPTIATNWIDDPELSWLTLTEGRAPTGVPEGAPLEVVIDVGTAEDERFGIGETAEVLTPARTAVTIVGLATFGDTERVGGVTYVAFDTDTAQEILAGSPDKISSVLVRAADGVSATDLERRLEAILREGLPDGMEAITGADLTAEQEKDIESDFLGMFRTILLVFAGIAMVVAAFSIHNTFSILVAQRTRESALMRAIGASRRQVILSVTAEALIIGVISTAIGFAAGVGIASFMQNLLEDGMDMPDATLTVGSGAVIAAAIIGIGTTLVASVGPALKASKVAPLAALRDVAVDRSATSKTRAIVGVVLTGVGMAAVITATSSEDGAMSRAGLGALAMLVGTVVLGPVVARPAAAILGAGPAATRGVAGRLARRNAMRNPRRTAASAVALLVGTAVVALFTTFGASIKASIDDTVDTNFAGDFVILPDGFSGSLLSPELAPALAGVDGVNEAVGASYGPAIIGGKTTEVAATDVTTLNEVFDVGLSSGTFDGFASGDVAISEHYADEHGLRLGSTIPTRWIDGATTDFSVAAIYEDRMTFGDVLMSSADMEPHFPQPQITVVLVDLDDEVGSDGADAAAVKSAVTAVTSEFGAPDPMDRAEYKDQVGAEIDGMLTFVYGLLGVAVFIALMGIANTLSLSIHERTRELGLLRAVGQDRAQVRSTVRWESVIIAVFGTLGGLALGSFLGWGLMRAMSAQEGFGVFALPVAPLAVILALAAGAGILAALRPSRRAAKTDILAAIASS